jgi:hypothetical protein
MLDGSEERLLCHKATAKNQVFAVYQACRYQAMRGVNGDTPLLFKQNGGNMQSSSNSVARMGQTDQ